MGILPAERRNLAARRGRGGEDRFGGTPTLPETTAVSPFMTNSWTQPSVLADTYLLMIYLWRRKPL